MSIFVFHVEGLAVAASAPYHHLVHSKKNPGIVSIDSLVSQICSNSGKKLSNYSLIDDARLLLGWFSWSVCNAVVRVLVTGALFAP